MLLQLGHQAAQCTNGTINWRQLYGDESFRLKQPLYESDLLKMHKGKAVDLGRLEAQARQYAAVSSPLRNFLFFLGRDCQAAVFLSPNCTDATYREDCILHGFVF